MTSKSESIDDRLEKYPYPWEDVPRAFESSEIRNRLAKTYVGRSQVSSERCRKSTSITQNRRRMEIPAAIVGEN